MVTAETRAARAPDVLAERVRGRLVVLDPETGRYVRLNASGAALWDALERPATVGTLAERLTALYAIDAGRASADAAAFVSALAERGLVELS